MLKKRAEKRQKQVITVKGTMKLHSVVGVSETEIMVRQTTCVCGECFTERGFVWSDVNQCGWEKLRISRDEDELDKKNNRVDEEIPPDTVDDSETAADMDIDREMTQEKATTEAEIVVGDFIAAKYDGVAYVGKVINVDDDTYEVTFMEQGSKVKDCLKQPTKPDIIWIDAKDIICKVKEPLFTGKGKRFFKITESDKAKIDKAFAKY